MNAYVSRSAAFLNKGDNDRAIADYTKAAQLDPKLAQEKGVDQLLAQLQKRQAQSAVTPLTKNAARVQ